MSILPRENGGGIFGQGMFSIDPNASPDQIARKREMIAALMPRFGQARYVGEGLGQLATGVAFGKMNRNLDKAEGAGRKSAAERFQQLLGGGTAQPGGFSILGAAPQPEPNSPQGIANDTMAALGKGPVGREFVVDGLVARNFPQHVAEGFAMNFADESAFNPQAVGDNGNAYGLAQWNGPRKRALFDFAERQGKNPADPNVQMDFLAHEVQGPESAAWGKIAATSDPRSAAAAVLNYFERPAETHRARREAAYLGGQAPSGGQGAPMEALYAAAADPWLDQGQRAIIMSMIQTRQQESDPLRQMQLQKGQLELEAMRNPGRETQYVDGVGLIDSATGEVINNYGGGKRKPIEVGGVLVDPDTYQPLYDSRQNDPEAPTTKQVKLADGSEVMVQWNPETKTWDPAPLPQGGTTGSGAKLTEGQSKLTLFKTMQNETSPVLSQLEQQFDPSNLKDPTLASIPIAGNYFTSPQYQVYSSAASAWAEGALRISTGAAATQPEIDRIVKVYFAQPGDTPATVKFKASMRDMYDRAINGALGKPKGDGTLMLPDDFASVVGNSGATPDATGPAIIKSDADYDALPSGSVFIDPDGKQRRKP